MNIYCFGNLLLKEDKTALDLIPILQKKFPEINFIEKDSEEGFDKKDVVIMDVVKGINKVTLIEDPEIITNKIYSVHDFDLGFNLVLGKKMGKITSIKLIALPYGGKIAEIEKDIIQSIQSLIE